VFFTLRTEVLVVLVFALTMAATAIGLVTGRQRAVVATSDEVERRLWRLAGQALDSAPEASAPRLYVESLNEAIDARVARVAGLDNRVPTPVLAVEVTGAAWRWPCWEFTSGCWAGAR
jgi:hypothetical protein